MLSGLYAPSTLSYPVYPEGKQTRSFAVRLALFFMVLLVFSVSVFAQGYDQGYPTSYIRKSAFQQEIARLAITVEREGQVPLPISMVPRVERGDVLRVRMLEEAINGIKPEESFWNWSFVVAYVNPSRNDVEDESVSREVNFKRDGWYREHLFKVPYDSQPVFFLYPKPKYRKKIRKLINKNFSEIKKIGEKTLEIAGAYAQIGSFLNQLQQLIEQNQYGNQYGSNVYQDYSNSGNSNNRQGNFGERFIEKYRIVESLAQSFNIPLPSCWNGGGSSYGGGFGGGSNDFISRAQCVAKNVRFEDFDLSVGRMIQQGGLVAADRLIQKFPQLAYWINVAAAAVDLMIKIMRRTPLRIVPTMAHSSLSNQDNSQQYNNYNNGSNGQINSLLPIQEKISLYAQNSATDHGFVTAFPIVMHKWQPDPDPELIALPTPSFLEPCVHLGQNILRNSDISYDWLRDTFTRDFKLVISAENGFSREFRLQKNLGMSGWTLMLTQEDIQALPKIKMTLEARVYATRGFSHIASNKFSIPISGGGSWEVTNDSAAAFSVGGGRRIVIRNTNGNARCLQSVAYRPSFGGEFTFVANSISNPLRFDKTGNLAWFDLDTANFQPGEGTLEFRTFGNQQQPKQKQLRLFSMPPEITKLGVHRGDTKLTIEGSRVDQIQSISIDGKMAQPLADSSSNPNSPNNPNNYGQNGQGNKRTFVFQNTEDRILSNRVSLELVLDGERHYKYPKSFEVLPARPVIEADEKQEIKASIIGENTIHKFDLSAYPVTSVETSRMTLAVKTTLADYSFRTENLSIETRIENGAVGQEALPRTTFEVLDPFNLRIVFEFNPSYQQFLAGRRLEFRIKDRNRGDSDWYKIKQTFVRIPSINSINCRADECVLSGKGLDYIGQVSTDGGTVWQPPLQVELAPDGKSFMVIRGVKNKNLLRIKLRDFPNTEGLDLK